jgi:hypothetical protein
VSNHFGLVIESLVAFLLLFTIWYCVLLNRRLKLFKADEKSLKTTISELTAATASAERAIAGLKLTVRDCDQGLGERLRAAERLSGDMDRKVEVGENLLSRLSRIVLAAQPSVAAQDGVAADPKAMVIAAQAFADRAQSRINGRAA